jgi:hypothetical protein
MYAFIKCSITVNAENRRRRDAAEGLVHEIYKDAGLCGT